ncbi:MAG TPA: type II toxin-antitoxin system VapC family toxin [Longimicrobiaceae bacterium]
MLDHTLNKGKLSATLGHLELLVDTEEMARQDFLIHPDGVRAIVDTVIITCLQKHEESLKRDKGPETKVSSAIPGLTMSRPDVFVRQLGRAGAIGISYLTLYEALDPKKPVADERGNRIVQSLDAQSKRVMFERIERLKQYNIRVVDVSSRAFRMALDMWFDARQGRIPRKSDPLLFDPIIAATAMATGAQLYSSNAKDFEPYSEQYELNFARVVQEGHYLGLPLAA